MYPFLFSRLPFILSLAIQTRPGRVSGPGMGKALKNICTYSGYGWQRELLNRGSLVHPEGGRQVKVKPFLSYGADPKFIKTTIIG